MWIYLLIVNIATFLVYVYDKSVSSRKMRRVPEGFLHTCSLIGGSLGALLAMQLVRHKTQKRKFQFIFWLIVLLQAIGLGYWLSRGRAAGLRAAHLSPMVIGDTIGESIGGLKRL